MKQVFKFTGVLALLVLAVGCETTSTSKTDMLSAAGFKLVAADNPKKQELLATLPADQLSLVTYKGKSFYVQPAGNNSAYVGTPAEFQTYQQLRLAKQISNDNVMAAQMNQNAMNNWGGAWGPSFYGAGFYGGRWR